MARAGASRDDVQRRQAEGFAAENWLKRTTFPKCQVLHRKGPGDLMLPTAEVIEVKSVPISAAQFVNGGEKPPKHRTIVVVTEGAVDEWFVLGEIRPESWVRGRPQWVANAQICWYAPRSRIDCMREWSCGHE
jgi:hypothetical protein